MLYIVKEHVYLYADLGLGVRFRSSSSINGLDKTFGYKSLPLSHIRSIKDGALRFFHVAHEEEASRDHVRPIRNQRLRCRHASIEVHRASLISTVLFIWTDEIKMF